MAVFITPVIPLLHAEPKPIADTRTMDASLNDRGTVTRYEFLFPSSPSVEDTSNIGLGFSVRCSVGVGLLEGAPGRSLGSLILKPTKEPQNKNKLAKIRSNTRELQELMNCKLPTATSDGPSPKKRTRGTSTCGALGVSNWMRFLLPRF
jgi:hypothetical protein